MTVRQFGPEELHLAVLRQVTGDFREPVIWLLLAIVARWMCWGRSA